MQKIKAITTITDFLSLKDDWNNVLAKSNEKNIFLTWEWIFTWWKFFGGDRQSLILTIEEDDEIISIAPLMSSKYKILGFNVKKIELMGTPDSDYNGLILAKDGMNSTKLFLDYIFNYECDWDFLTLKDIPENSKTAQIIPQFLINSTNFSSRNINRCPYKIITSDYNDFFYKIKKKLRNNIKYRIRKLNKNGIVEYKTYEEYNSITKAMNILFKLNKNRCRQLEVKSTFNDPVKRDFHIELANLLAKNNWLKLGFLTLDNVPIAAEYSFSYGNKIFAYLSGFDSEYKNYGVGRICELYHIKHLIEKGYQEYDWLRGFEQYISDWTGTYRNNLELRYAKDNLITKVYKFLILHKNPIKNVYNILPEKIKENIKYL